MDNVEIFADRKSYEVLKSRSNVFGEEKFGIEFLSLKLSIKTVSSLEEALSHIEKYSSRHSEGIVSENRKNIDKPCANKI